jgi:hypothetical protein
MNFFIFYSADLPAEQSLIQACINAPDVSCHPIENPTLPNQAINRPQFDDYRME